MKNFVSPVSGFSLAENSRFQSSFWIQQRRETLKLNPVSGQGPIDKRQKFPESSFWTPLQSKPSIGARRVAPHFLLETAGGSNWPAGVGLENSKVGGAFE